MVCSVAKSTMTSPGLDAMMATYLYSILTLLRKKIIKSYNKESMISSYLKMIQQVSKKNTLYLDSISAMWI